tara:strand:+ start:3079 stop:3555 length:477 start_codon:yes stop_codon:yes gene_type:complete
MIDKKTEEALQTLEEHQELIRQLAFVGILAVLGVMREPDALERDADNTESVSYKKGGECLVEDITLDGSGHDSTDCEYPYVLGKTLSADLRSPRSIVRRYWGGIASALESLQSSALNEIILRRNDEEFFEQLPDEIKEDVYLAVFGTRPATAQPHEEK